jgi:Domain of unknown function (DUF1906)
MIPAAAFDSIGFDTDAKLTLDSARAIRTTGLVWGARYVSLGAEVPTDLDGVELSMLVEEIGFRIIIVQHVLFPNWRPSDMLGAQHGVAAARDAKLCGYPQGAHLFVDDEGMLPTAGAAAAIEYTEAWAKVVRDAGYRAGGYFGYGCLMNPAQLYGLRGINSYWAAPRKKPDRSVAVRDYAIEQTWPEVKIGGVPIDLDLLHADALGERPWWCSAF